MFVSKFRKKPMHFFGLLGTIIFLFGFIVAGYLAYMRYLPEGYRMTERPIFFWGCWP
jgi:TRAP-type mannitol/chloroaromatic compound transport system permease small subunit